MEGFLIYDTIKSQLYTRYIYPTENGCNLIIKRLNKKEEMVSSLKQRFKIAYIKVPTL